MNQTIHQQQKLNAHVGTRRGRYAEQEFHFPRDLRPSCRGAALIRREKRRRRLFYGVLWIAWAGLLVVLVLLAGSTW